MTTRDLLRQMYPEWDSNRLRRAAVYNRLLRAGYEVDAELASESIAAVRTLIEQIEADEPTLTPPPPQMRVAGAIGAPSTFACKVCHRPTTIALLGSGAQAYYCASCKAAVAVGEIPPT